jgi:hypothetical protein
MPKSTNPSDGLEQTYERRTRQAFGSARNPAVGQATRDCWVAESECRGRESGLLQGQADLVGCDGSVSARSPMDGNTFYPEVLRWSGVPKRAGMGGLIRAAFLSVQLRWDLHCDCVSPSLL